MRKEIIGILLFFIVIFTLGSLLSYSPEDPSIHNAKPLGNVNNLFGIFGAQISSILIGLFGLGAFWIPILFLLSSIHVFSSYYQKAIFLIIAGGIILIISTGSLLALQQNQFMLFGNKFSSGGMIGIPIKTFLINYTNQTGGAVILILMFLIGFIMTTGFSLIIFFKKFWELIISSVKSTKKLIILCKERKKKAKKQSKIKKEHSKKKSQEIKIKTKESKPIRETPAPKQDVFEFMKAEKGVQLPSINLLENPEVMPTAADDKNLKMQSKLLEKKLEDFNVQGKVVTILPGPVITTFEYEPAPGIKINKIVGLTDDLALALRSTSIRIVAPIPGKAAIGIELPNETREMVRLKEIIISSSFKNSKSKLTIALGKDIIGDPVVAELDTMPHLLIAGATGAGKSVALNAMICSFLFKANPDEVKLIMIDPKRIELSSYDGIPHLITPVVTDVKKATNALFWAVREMEQRYKLLSEKKARNIKQYNQKIAQEKAKNQEEPVSEKLPYIVIIIDELADLMIAASRNVEVALTRLAQMARAAGIHLIIATQRPSVDVLTGIIKANFPTRLSFQVSSKTDSRTIIDTNGAENLLGNGDMLFLPPGTAKIHRIHGAYISEKEIVGITEFLKKQKTPEYDHAVITESKKEKAASEDLEYDEKYDEAIALITKTGQASISMIQRHLRIGYNRAARIIEIMEKEGIVGPSEGIKPREVLVRSHNNIP